MGAESFDEVQRQARRLVSYATVGSSKRFCKTIDSGYCCRVCYILHLGMLGYAPLKATSAEAVLCITFLQAIELELHEQVMSINGYTTTFG